MKIPVFHSAPFTLLGMVFLSAAFVHASPPPADSVHSCLHVDFEQWKQEHPRPALKRLADLNVGEPFTVRMIYFLPNDRPYRGEAVQRMKEEILNIQTFYAEQMEAHEYGARTFRIETDNQGDPMVHRVDGQHPDSHYLEDTFFTVVEEVGQIFDGNGRNVHFIVIENSTNKISGRGGAAWARRGGGEALVPGDFWPKTAAHELGHAFGLWHDFHKNAYIMSYYPLADQLSACSAEFLSVSPYFNSTNPADADVEDDTQNPTIELLSPSEYTEGATSVPVRLRLSAPGGLHQVLLLAVSEYYQEEVMACRGLAGEEEAVVEFDYDGVIPSSTFATLLNLLVHPIRLQAVDIEGNVSQLSFDLVALSPYHIATLEGHTNWVMSVAFSPDGNTLASGSLDGTVRLWDVGMETEISNFRGLGPVVFSPDGTILAAAIGNEIGLWNVATRQATGSLYGHTNALAFSPDGTILASGSGDQTIKLYDIGTRQIIATLEGHADWINGVSFSHDGTILASGSSDGTIKLWDLTTNKLIDTLDAHRYATIAVSFSPDGNVLASVGNRELKLWDFATKKTIAKFEGGSYVAFSRDGTVLASGADDHTIKLWDVFSKESIVELRHTSTVFSVSFSPDILASASIDGTVRLWDVSELMPPPPHTLLKISGDNQEGTPGLALSEPMVVEVRDQYGSPLPGARVTFTVTEGSGRLNGRSNSAVLVTDADGRAQSILTLGTNPGMNTVEVSVSGVEMTFSAVGVGTPTLPTMEDDFRTWNLPYGAILRLGKGGVGNDRRAVYFLPDGQGLSVANKLGIWVHDVATFRPLTLLPVTANWLYYPSMRTFAFLKGDGVDLWDVVTGANTATLGPHGGKIRSFALSLDGRMLATGNDFIKVWNVATGENTAILEGHRGTITDMVFSPDGTTLASGDWFEGEVKLWDVATGANIAILEGHRHSIKSLAFSPDGATLASGSSDHTAKLWDVETATNTATLLGHKSPITSVAFSPDGTILASAEYHQTGAVRLWDVATGANTAILEGHWFPVTSLAFSPDGTLASGSWYDGTVKLWDLVSGSSTPLPGHTDEIASVAFSPDGSTLASATWPDGTVKLWDLATGTHTTILKGHWFPLSSVEYSLDGTIAVAFSPDGTMLASGARDNTVKLWEVATGRNTATFYGHTGRVYSVAFSPDGTMLASGSWDNTLKLWDLTTGTEAATLNGHTDDVYPVAFSPDGTMLASGALDNSVKLWDVATGTNTATLSGHSSWVWSIAFSPDGTMLASGSPDKTVKLWDVATETNSATLNHTGQVFSLAFSPDGTTLAFTSNDRTIRLWDVAAREEIATLEGHKAATFSVAFSPDGTTLASGSDDGTVLLWDLQLVQPQPESLSKLSGDDQQGLAGAALPQPFVVLVLDQYGDPFPGATVEFSVSTGAGTLSKSKSTTDDKGHASSTLTLGRNPGTNTVDVTVAGAEPVIFTSTGEAIPRTLSKLSGDKQEGHAGAALPEPFVVEVRDQIGNPLAGAQVTFAVTAGGGTLSTTTDTTDANGRAAVTLTLGSLPGANTVSVRVAKLKPVAFIATGQAVPQTLAKLSGDGQQAAPGASLSEPFVVSVADQTGAALAGVPVTFAVTAGGGTLSETTATTDADGHAASTLTLGELGTNTIEVTVTGLDPVIFTASAEATPDFDGDGETGFSDFFLFADAFGSSDPRFDLDGSGSVDFADFFLLADHFGDPARGKLLALAREMIGLPDGPKLQQNAPNPFNSETVLSWFLLRPGSAKVEVFALTGQRVAVLRQGPQKAGFHQAHWDGRDDRGRPLASGVYLYRLATTGSVQTRKLTLLR